LSELKTPPTTTAAASDPLPSLLPRALAGDAVALRGLLAALAPEVARVARAVVGSSAADLDDVVQECLLGLLHALPAFRGECGLRRFANRIAVRTALRARRRGLARVAQNEAFSAEVRGSELHHAKSRAPDEHWLAEQRRVLLCRLLAELPEAQAETLALRVVLGLSLEETAQATAVPVNTVRSRMRLARAALRARIETDPALRDLLGGAP
jgi:RNA polymerase sigma factor (sigma-70 family)